MRLEAHIPDVIRHTALRSPDFPPPLDAYARAAAIIQPPALSVYRGTRVAVAAFAALAGGTEVDRNKSGDVYRLAADAVGSVAALADRSLGRSAQQMLALQGARK